MATLAFLGTGMIGSGLVLAALERGDAVRVYNRTKSKMAPLAEAGANAFETPFETVEGVDRVHVALSDDAAVDAVLEACEGALSGNVLVDHTTTAPAGTKARAARLAQAGVRFVHAPVFMSPGMCRSGQGIMLAAGPRAVFDSVKAELEKMTGKVSYLGERPDAAAAYKLFGNAMILTIVGGLADVYAMAAELDITPADAHALFGQFNPTGVVKYRGKNMAEGNYAASFELTMARKDVRLMIESAGDRALSTLPGLAARMDALIEAGYGQDDVGVLSVESVPKST